MSIVFLLVFQLSDCRFSSFNCLPLGCPFFWGCRKGIWSPASLLESGCKTVCGGKTLEKKGFDGITPFWVKTRSAEEEEGILATLFAPVFRYFLRVLGAKI